MVRVEKCSVERPDWPLEKCFIFLSFREWIGHFHDLLRANPSFLFMLVGYSRPQRLQNAR
jgi:hypothetical protein